MPQVRSEAPSVRAIMPIFVNWLLVLPVPDTCPDNRVRRNDPAC